MSAFARCYASTISGSRTTSNHSSPGWARTAARTISPYSRDSPFATDLLAKIVDDESGRHLRPEEGGFRRHPIAGIRDRHQVLDGARLDEERHLRLPCIDVAHCLRKR